MADWATPTLKECPWWRDDMMFNDTLSLDEIEQLAKALTEQETENN